MLRLSPTHLLIGAAIVAMTAECTQHNNVGVQPNQSDAEVSDVGHDGATDPLPAPGDSLFESTGRDLPDDHPGDLWTPDLQSAEAASETCGKFPSRCAALPGATFASTTAGWGSVAFGKLTFLWKYADSSETGTYSCTGGEIVGTKLAGEQLVGRVEEADCNAITWTIAGNRFWFRLKGERDPAAPEPAP